MPENGVLIFEGFDDSLARSKVLKHDHRIQANSMQWSKIKGVPIKPTVARVRAFKEAAKREIIQRKATGKDIVGLKVISLDGKVKVKKAQAKALLKKIESVDRQLKKLPGGTDAALTAWAYGLALGVKFVRETVRAHKYTMAKTILMKLAPEDRIANRAELIALARTIEELPIKVRIPDMKPVDEFFSSEKLTDQVIKQKGKWSGRRSIGIRRKTLKQTSEKYVSTYPVSFGGFDGFDAWTIKLGGKSNVVDFAKQQATNAVNSLKNQVIQATKQAADDAIASGREYVSRQINESVKPALQNAMNVLSQSELPTKQIYDQGREEIGGNGRNGGFKWTSIILPVSVIAGGVWLVTKLIK